MQELSLDPRVNRLNLEDSEEKEERPVEDKDHGQTFEVFHQKKKGTQHQHVGVVHAPNSDMALVLAKEQFSRRGETANLWVVRSAEVVTTSYDDEDIFDTTPEKTHREPQEYKVRDKVNKYQESKKDDK